MDGTRKEERESVYNEFSIIYINNNSFIWYMPFIKELLKYSNQYFIETGTYKGDTVECVRMSKIYDSILSMELSEPYYNRCSQRFKNDDTVSIYYGNSRYDLTNIIGNIDKEITFWLDSHWSGGAENFEIGCDPDTKCPILYELEQIKNHPIKTHTIMVDDIRLMDGSHFLVTKDEIETKIMEINPNYKIQYYNDECAENDVLVAYIDKKCIHTYLTTCKTNPQPPGIGDFLRGSIALYQFANRHGYTLYFQNDHPIFRYLQPSPYVIKDNSDSVDVLELIPPLSYDSIKGILYDKFISGETFTVMTNSFYEHDITDDCKSYFKKIFTPSVEIQRKIEGIFSSVYHIPMDQEYVVIHLRFGDKFIHRNEYDQNIFDEYYSKINGLGMIEQNKNVVYILLCDSDRIATIIKNNIPKLCYWNNKKIHLGDLQETPTNSEGDVMDTMTDFFILSKAKEILSNGSGFSRYISRLFDIPYVSI